MKRTQLIILVTVVALAGVGSYVWYRQVHRTTPLAVVHASPVSTATPPKQTNAAATGKQPASKPTNITSTAPAGLLNASYSRNLTDFTAWQDSPVSVEYRDFNSDGINDAFVWAKLPGTMGYSYAAVWTTDSAGQPLELWYLPNDLSLSHSTWSVTANNGLENKSVNGDGTTNTINTFHWQVTSTGHGFVLEPNI